MGISWRQFVDETEVRKALSVFKPDGELFEIRILKDKGKRKETISGYFRSQDVLFDKLDTVDLRNTNIYFSLGCLKDALYSRSQRDALRQVQQTTSDSEIEGYRWFFVDIDPVRPSGISSSADEMRIAKQKAADVAQYLQDIGFEEPVKAISGNGYHILYRIALANNKENVQLVEQCLKVLSQLFDTDEVKIDTTNYNPSRICKLHGTLAQKGANTADRPHRFSRILSIPDEIRDTKKAYLVKLANELRPQKDNRQTVDSRYQPFNLEEWLGRYGLEYDKRDGDRATIYALDECPFDHNHRNGDSKIFLYDNGAVAFKCHHNSCSAYRWQDVRMKFEPEAYDRTDADDRYEKGWQEHNRNKTAVEIAKKDDDPKTADGVLHIFRTAEEILQDPEPEYEYIKTGIKTIDNLTAGLAKTELTAISGLTGSGKSTLLAQIMLNAVNKGHRVVCYSGEMSNKKYLNWMLRQAAGKTNMKSSQNVSGEYDIRSDELRQKIAAWMGDKFRLYDNRQGNDFQKIRTALEKVLTMTKADLCVIDNLMILDLAGMDGDRYEAQKKFVVSLKDLALKTNTHVLFVAHPRKTAGLLQLTDIAGSANIGNILDNGYVVHRCTPAFEKAFKEDRGGSPYEAFAERPTNIIEILKDREHGHMNRLIPLYYEAETKRLKNSPSENEVYSWQERREADFVDVETDEEF